MQCSRKEQSKDCRPQASPHNPAFRRFRMKIVCLSAAILCFAFCIPSSHASPTPDNEQAATRQLEENIPGSVKVTAEEKQRLKLRSEVTLKIHAIAHSKSKKVDYHLDGSTSEDPDGYVILFSLGENDNKGITVEEVAKEVWDQTIPGKTAATVYYYVESRNPDGSICDIVIAGVILDHAAVAKD